MNRRSFLEGLGALIAVPIIPIVVEDPVARLLRIIEETLSPYLEQQVFESPIEMDIYFRPQIPIQYIRLNVIETASGFDFSEIIGESSGCTRKI